MNFRTHVFPSASFCIFIVGTSFLKLGLMSFLNFFGFGKLRNLFAIIRAHGGLLNSYKSLVRTDELKVGKLVGVDNHGNKYYQNDNYFYGRNRWVIYADKFGYDYDASQVSPEWYGWLHYKTDLLPSEDKSRPKHKWMAEPSENYTGTPKQYVPYSTTPRKIEPWIPPKRTK